MTLRIKTFLASNDNPGNPLGCSRFAQLKCERTNGKRKESVTLAAQQASTTSGLSRLAPIHPSVPLRCFTIKETRNVASRRTNGRKRGGGREHESHLKPIFGISNLINSSPARALRSPSAPARPSNYAAAREKPSL